MQLTSRYLSLLLFLVVGIWACSDSHVPRPARFRIAKMQKTYDYSYFVPSRVDTIMSTYFYDNDGKLVNVAGYYRSVSYSTYLSTLYYNNQDQLTEVRTLAGTSTFPPYPTSDLGTTMEYNYNKEGNISAINVYTIQYTGYKFLKEEYKFIYDKGNKPSSLSWKLNYGSQFDPYRYEDHEFIYEDGNVTSVLVKANPVRSNNYKSSTYTWNIRYDKKINPFYQLSGPPLFSYDFILNLSKNNQLKSDELYSYDSNDLLIKSTNTNGQSVTNYYYETY